MSVRLLSVVNFFLLVILSFGLVMRSIFRSAGLLLAGIACLAAGAALGLLFIAHTRVSIDRKLPQAQIMRSSLPG